MIILSARWVCLTRHSRENFLLITSLYQHNNEGLLFVLISLCLVCVFVWGWGCVHAHTREHTWAWCVWKVCVCTQVYVWAQGMEANLGCWSSLSTLSATKSLVCSYMQIGELAIKLGCLWYLPPISPQDHWVTDSCATQPGSSWILRTQTQSLLLAWWAVYLLNHFPKLRSILAQGQGFPSMVDWLCYLWACVDTEHCGGYKASHFMMTRKQKQSKD